jgi:hypothetical protein
MDRVNSMIMVERLKRTLVEELRSTLEAGAVADL